MVWRSLEILWPTRCAGCDTEGHGQLCGACDTALQIRALAALPGELAGGFAAAAYDGPLGIALKRAKYGRDPALLSLLAARFAQIVAPFALGGVFDAVVPVPSPWTRVIARGFSTGAVLSHHLCRTTGLPLRHALRLRPGRRNAGLDAIERRSNLEGRLWLRRAVPGRVLLIDDVFTTGSTARAAARQLLRGPTRSVWIATLCVSETRGDDPSRGNPPLVRTRD
ncbi:MAG TPA: ComF family protein [Deltaproteobacteria bacterium]|nr:ComF family protein [Deltaproteobacteria bacterium]